MVVVVDELGRDGSARDPEPAEVLVLGPRASSWRARSWRRPALVFCVVALVASGAWAWRWWQSASPTFTTDEVVSTYTSLPSVAGGSVAWEQPSVTTHQGDHRLGAVGARPVACEPVILGDVPPADGDRVNAGFGASGSTAPYVIPLGDAVTFRYDAPADARTSFRTITDALAQCTRFTEDGVHVRVTAISASRETWTRSGVRFQVTTEDSVLPVWFGLVRYGNTVTWVVSGDREHGAADVEAKPDMLLAGLRATYRAR